MNIAFVNFFTKKNKTQPKTIEQVVISQVLLVTIPFFLLASALFLSFSIYREIVSFNSEVKIHLANLTDLIAGQIKSVNTRNHNLINIVIASINDGEKTKNFKIKQLLYSQVNNPEAEIFCIAAKISDDTPLVVMRDSGNENQVLRDSAIKLAKEAILSPHWNSFETGRLIVKYINDKPYFLVTAENSILSKKIKMVLLVNASLFTDSLIQASQTMRSLDVITNFKITSSEKSILLFGKPDTGLFTVKFERIVPDMNFDGRPVMISIWAKKTTLVQKIFFSLMFSLASALMLVYILKKVIGHVLKKQIAPVSDLRLDVDNISQMVILHEFNSNFEQGIDKISTLKNKKTGIIEIDEMASSFLLLVDRLRHSELEKLNLSRKAGIVEIAAQVSHDIRSPLAALSMVTGQLINIPENYRVLIRHSVQRINDIANELLQKSKELKNQTVKRIEKESPYDLTLSIELISPIIDSLVSEKRVQFREKQGIEIEADINSGYGLFANINPTELHRTLSNLINNSVESFQQGKILVSIKAIENKVILIVQDNGKGIPAHILAKLGEMGISHGKENSQSSGSGLGVYHAKKTIESFGGKFEITSVENKGTTITMTFPKASAPKWFVEKLSISPELEVISLDDDLSIHQIWKGRFESLNSSINHLTFTSGIEFKNFVNNNLENKKRIYLVDFELLNQNQTGLEIIEELNLGPQAILVTSRYEEDAVRTSCQNLEVKLIPKAMAGFVPIEIEMPKKLVDIILIDDDQLIHLVWKSQAQKFNKTFVDFYTFDDFIKQALEFDFNSTIYIDSNLKDGVKGEEVSKMAFELGFKNIYLCTGYSADTFPSMPWIKGIMGKELRLI